MDASGTARSEALEREVLSCGEHRRAPGTEQEHEVKGSLVTKCHGLLPPTGKAYSRFRAGHVKDRSARRFRTHSL